MNIIIFAPQSIPLSEVAAVLRREGLNVSCVNTDLQNVAEQSRQGNFQKGIVIFSQHGVAELTERVYSALVGQKQLILCIPQPNVSDRKLLVECGAAEIVTPQSWSAIHIADRLLGRLISDGDIAPDRCGSLRGGTLSMRNLYEDITTTARLSDPILILGETGTGKELAAREIHRLSNRSDKLVAINCAELSLELSGSELFGHEKGSYTGAARDRRGLLAEAGRGTVFLDEIGELDLHAQARLLRVLEEKKVRPVGSNKFEDIAARFILATNRNLTSECEKGSFRADLFQRIKGFTLFMPPLRTRKADIPLLVRHFLDEFNSEYEENLQIPAGALDCLFEYDWIGNVRELRATVRKAAAYRKGEYLSALHLKETVASPLMDNASSANVIKFDPRKDSWREIVSRTQLAYFKAILVEAGQNKELAAKLSGLSRSQFYKKLEEIKFELGDQTD